eukprot:341882-Hanusia_phi.AAC.2
MGTELLVRMGLAHLNGTCSLCCLGSPSMIYSATETRDHPANREVGMEGGNLDLMLLLLVSLLLQGSTDADSWVNVVRKFVSVDCSRDLIK